jgi:putative ABC transport system permease protein
MGVNEYYLEIASREIIEGRFFSLSEVQGGSKVAVIGKTLSETIFGNMNPIGQVVRFNKMPVQIIGLLKSRGEAGMGGGDQEILVNAIFCRSASHNRNFSLHMLNVRLVCESVEYAKLELKRSSLKSQDLWGKEYISEYDTR